MNVCSLCVKVNPKKSCLKHLARIREQHDRLEYFLGQTQIPNQFSQIFEEEKHTTHKQYTAYCKSNKELIQSVKSSKNIE